MRNLPTFFNQVKAETAKVVWPSRRETVMTAVMVVA
ncbi:preprotein translocase subunit SecE, partial [Sphingomonas bacterium]